MKQQAVPISGMAEAVFKQKVKELGYADRFDVIDSFGTSGIWHIGEKLPIKVVSTCRKYGVPVNHLAHSKFLQLIFLALIM